MISRPKTKNICLKAEKAYTLCMMNYIPVRGFTWKSIVLYMSMNLWIWTKIIRIFEYMFTRNRWDPKSKICKVSFWSKKLTDFVTGAHSFLGQVSGYYPIVGSNWQIFEVTSSYIISTMGPFFQQLRALGIHSKPHTNLKRNIGNVWYIQ